MRRRLRGGAGSLLFIAAALALAIAVAVRDFPRGSAALACVRDRRRGPWHGVLVRGGHACVPSAWWSPRACDRRGSPARRQRPSARGRADRRLRGPRRRAGARRVHRRTPRCPARRRRASGPVLQPAVGRRQGDASTSSDEARARGIEPIQLTPGDDLGQLVATPSPAAPMAWPWPAATGRRRSSRAIAAEHGLPYACIPAGTRNHFALDLGVDRDDVVGALDAFVDGGERRVDLAEVNGRVFVNNVSLGLYADAVQQEGYRDAKLRTLLDTVPDVLGPDGERARPALDAGRAARRIARARRSSSRTTPTGSGRAVGSGTRPRIDDGRARDRRRRRPRAGEGGRPAATVARVVGAGSRSPPTPRPRRHRRRGRDARAAAALPHPPAASCACGSRAAPGRLAVRRHRRRRPGARSASSPASRSATTTPPDHHGGAPMTDLGVAADPAPSGKAARSAIPRSSHAEWQAPADRRRPRGRARGAGRLAGRRAACPSATGACSTSPFAFYRGAAALMAADLATTPSIGRRRPALRRRAPVELRRFASPERNLIFDLNDFDETLPGPWEWDVKRLAASLAVAGRERGFDDAERRARRAGDGLRLPRGDARLRGACARWRSGTRALDTSSDLRAALDAQLHGAAAQGGSSAAWRRPAQGQHARVRQARHARSTGAAHRRRPAADRRRSRTCCRRRPSAQRIEVRRPRLLAAYRGTLPPDRRVLFDRYRVRDAGAQGRRGRQRRHAGVVCSCSGPRRRRPAVPAGQGGGALRCSRPIPGPSVYDNQGRRVVEGQRLMQAASDILLGWLRADRVDGRDARLLHPPAVGLEGLGRPGPMVAGRHDRYARLCAWTLARAHARTGDATAIGAYLGSGRRFDRAAAASPSLRRAERARLPGDARRHRVGPHPGRRARRVLSATARGPAMGAARGRSAGQPPRMRAFSAANSSSVRTPWSLRWASSLSLPIGPRPGGGGRRGHARRRRLLVVLLLLLVLGAPLARLTAAHAVGHRGRGTRHHGGAGHAAQKSWHRPAPFRPRLRRRRVLP